MGKVYDNKGNLVGSVNGWTGVHDTANRKVGTVNIWNSNVTDSNGWVVGRADSNGNVSGITGRFLCQVAFWGNDVKDSSGKVIGSISSAGAPEPSADMQYRGAAALLLLCSELQKEDIERVQEEVRNRPPKKSFWDRLFGD